MKERYHLNLVGAGKGESVIGKIPLPGRILTDESLDALTNLMATMGFSIRSEPRLSREFAKLTITEDQDGVDFLICESCGKKTNFLPRFEYEWAMPILAAFSFTTYAEADGPSPSAVFIGTHVRVPCETSTTVKGVTTKQMGEREVRITILKPEGDGYQINLDYKKMDKVKTVEEAIAAARAIQYTLSFKDKT